MSRMCQIKASAGSGKTYALTQQYLRLMTNMMDNSPHSPRHGLCKEKPIDYSYRMGDILAITFTNAAVNEIRKRVIDNLKKISLGKMEMEGVDKDKAGLCLEALLDNMDEMNVRTIDSLLHQIVRAASLSLGLNPDFEPVFKAPEAIKPYLDKYMEEAFLGDEEKREAIKEAVKNFLEHSKSEDKLILGKDLASELESLLEDVLLSKYSVTYEDAGERKGLLDRPPYEMKAPLPYSDYNTAKEGLENFTRAILEKGEKIRVMAEAHKADPNKKEIKWNTAFGNFLKELGNGLRPTKFDFLDKPFSKQVDARAKQDFDRAPFESIYEEMTQDYIDYLACQEHIKYSLILSLGEAVVDEYSKDSRQAKALPSILIPVLAEKALSLETGVCDALCRLGSRLTHFLLDEFQDTSAQQWAGIYSLISEALSTNGSLTWVGDIKQSIYMWRNASPELFDMLKEDTELTRMIPEDVDGKLLPCNRRSAANIVEFNNKLFGTLNGEKIGEILSSINSSVGENPKAIDKIREAFKDCAQELPENADPDGLVAVRMLDDGEFWESFGEELLSFIKTRVEEKKEIALSDIMIIVRANDDASEVAVRLAAENVPVITENSLVLNGEELIREAVALLEFMANPGNDQALLSVLCGKTFLEHPELTGMDANDFHALGFEKGNKRLYKYFKEKYPELWGKLLEPFYKNASILPPYDVIREWFRNMGLEKRFPEKKILLSAFLEYLHRAELAGYNSISAFLEHWYKEGVGSKAIMPEGVDAVRILTIHKAKGLQAPVVFVPLRGESMLTNPQQHNKRIQYQADDLNLSVRLLKAFAKDYEKAMIRESQEILNLMYVAFTRPEKELYVFSSPEKSKQKKDSKTLLETMMGCVEMPIPYDQGSAWVNEKRKNQIQDEEKEIKAAESPKQENEGLSFPWISKLKVARNTLFTDKDSARRRGTFIHFCLENICLTDNPERDAQQVFDFGLSHSGIELSEEDLKGVKEGLLWFISQKEAKDWLKRAWPEHPMLDGEGNELRMDLMVPQDWGALVIDYKSGQMAEKNKEQMRAYLRCLKDSGEFGDKVCGLLVYLDERKFLPLDLEGEGEASEVCPVLPFTSQLS